MGKIERKQRTKGKTKPWIYGKGMNIFTKIILILTKKIFIGIIFHYLFTLDILFDDPNQQGHKIKGIKWTHFCIILHFRILGTIQRIPSGMNLSVDISNLVTSNSDSLSNTKN